MEYVCDAPNGRAWFRLVSEAEAVTESLEMRHAVEKHYRREREKAAESFRPISTAFIEQEIGKEAHIQREMPLFLTLRNQEGEALVTAMLPARGHAGSTCIIVGTGNSDPYPDHGDAIRALGQHYGLTLERAACFPYRR